MQPLADRSAVTARWNSSRHLVRQSVCAIALGTLELLGVGPSTGAPNDHAAQPLTVWQYRVTEEALQDPDADTRKAALIWLGYHGRPDQANPANADLIADLGRKLGEPSQRIAVLSALAAIGPAGGRFAPDVAALLHDPAVAVRGSAASTLGAMGESGARFAPNVAELLSDRSQNMIEVHPEIHIEGPGASGQAAAALGAMGSAAARYAPQVAALLNDHDWGVRAAAATALAAMGATDSRYASAVGAMLFDHLNKKVIDQPAAKALAAMGESGATVTAEHLPTLISNPDVNVRRMTANLLGVLGVFGTRFAPQMRTLLTDPDPDVRDAAVGAIGRMTEAGSQFAPDLARLLSDSSERRGIRIAAGEALGHIGQATPVFAQEVAGMLTDNGGNMHVRLSAAVALAAMGHSGARFTSSVLPLLHDHSSFVRSVAISTLEDMGRAGAPVGPDIATLLLDENAEVRTRAASALMAIGPGGVRYAPQVAARLDDVSADARKAASDALSRAAWWNGPISTPSLRAACLQGAVHNRDHASQIRLTCHLLGPLSGAEKTLMLWVSDQAPDPASLTKKDTVKVLTDLLSMWSAVDARKSGSKVPSYPELRGRVAAQLEALAATHRRQFNVGDLPMLERLTRTLESADLGEAAAVRDVRDGVENLGRALRVLEVIGVHAGLWALLIWAYPRWRPVQGFFFWNRWGRRFLGLGYVGLLIAFVPWLRQRMFSPFKASLVQRGAIAGFDEPSYFPDSEVIEQGRKGDEGLRRPLSTVLPDVDSQVVLEGESGLGKTTALLRLAKTSRRIAVLLRATECREGVVAAIQARLKGQISDESYLRTLIHVGAIDVLIDGLNEATPETRSRIVQFVEELFRGNFIVTTQPMDWERPRTARVMTLQPLQPEQIEGFLVRQWPAIARSATLDEDTYVMAVRTYVAELIGDADDLTGLRILGNPMEASIVAELLARGERPDLLRLVEQRFATMEAEFRSRENRPFPYVRFAEEVYAWRASGTPYFDPTGFDAEVSMLVSQKLMVERTVTVRSADANKDVTRWWFRHDRFMEFCLLPAFMGEHVERQRQHVGNEAFFGVYDLLALRLPDDEERELWKFLAENAADTRRNELLNRYTIARRARTVESKAGAESSAQLMASKSAT
ncbi:HEAT repeat domain-containing protein [Burkholderia sp. Ac-20353]|uniref:HEAT repeat domain-containing protein n=1 Tax=Burkholderia sp. Ac-20353 TaxID=2703894 RepID=UPI00197C6885|nr:HEAT repeat domain-containing protein [Burkholderia sp. Ac-20353]MBN3788814.1 hypothetical protein [Burkholderia sp. Ac-20353]